LWKEAREPVNRPYVRQLFTALSDIFVRNGALERFSKNSVLKPANDLSRLSRKIATTRVVVFEKGLIIKGK